MSNARKTTGRGLAAAACALTLFSGNACGEKFTADTAGPSSGGSGGSGNVSGSAGSAGRGGRSGGSGGSSSGGASSGGTAGASSGGTAGASSGGTAGASSGGTAGTGSGGTADSGPGGTTGGVGGADGSGGTGGGPECVPGTLECDAEPPRRCSDEGMWQRMSCGPLRAADVTSLNTIGMPGFNLGFRCKSLTVCAPGQDCIYYGQHLGSVQSNEASLADGAVLPQPEAVRVVITSGAASQCGNPPLTMTAGERLEIAHDGKKSHVYFPATTATELTVYVREDGATFHDAALTNLAQPPP
jgi:hypothetical protein